MLSLSTPIASLQFVGPSYSSKLKKLEIDTLEDLVFHIPFRYLDFSVISKIAQLQEGEQVSVHAKIREFKNVYTKSRISIQKAKITDDTGELEVVWYNQPYLANVLKTGATAAFAAVVKKNYKHQLYFEVPEFEILFPGKVPLHTGRLVPVYPETSGVSSKWLRSRIFPLLPVLLPEIVDYMPADILREYNLLPLSEALLNIHFPPSRAQALEAKRRICFDELFILQLAASRRKKEWEKKNIGIPFDTSRVQTRLDSFIGSLPFSLTEAQKRCFSEITKDLGKSVPMNRLLQGDVGSGKTIVATLSMLVCLWNGYHVAFMAPTEILAQQHFQTLSGLFEKWGIDVTLITGKSKKRDATFPVVIGTHALLSKSLSFEKLGLVVIDEQQRFGVQQRAVFQSKGKNPHLLSMTATPIPRTIALTLYADLDLSLLDQMPHGRQKIKTWVIGPQKRDGAYDWIHKKIVESRYTQQAYIVCPFIEESDSLESVKAAKVEFDRLKTSVYPDLKLGLLHGKMKSHEKEAVLNQFKSGAIQILVTTPVVEVGIDVSAATIMLIEAADRFGLAQLHQLRGRVGRSDVQSFCIIVSDAQNEKTIQRLKLLEQFSSGHILAEYDLKLRGQGDLFGTAQHGTLGLKYADMQDIALIKSSQEAVQKLQKENPTLKKVPLLRNKLQKYTIHNIVNN